MSAVTVSHDARVSELRGRPFHQKLVYALKLASWPKLFAPMLLGQSIGIADAGKASLPGFLAGFAFTTLDVIYIVLLNDWGDRGVDAIKRRRFPSGCSPKTIPDGILPAHTVLLVGIVSAVVALGLAAFVGPRMERPHFLPLAMASLLLFAVYTFKPLALNYRGGGEFLEMLGVGLLLPLLNAYLQSGVLLPVAELRTFAPLVPALALLALSSAIASGISDEESDREGGKRTFATAFRNARTRSFVEQTYVGGAILLAIVPSVVTKHFLLWPIPAALLLAVCFPAIRRSSPSAVTNAFVAQNHFKEKLHIGLWAGQLVLGASLVVKTLARM